MSLMEQIYSVLVVSASEKFNQSLPEVLPVPIFSPVNVVSDISSAKRAISERDFDIVIINSPLPGDNGVRFAIDVVDMHNGIVLFMAKQELYNDVYEKLVKSGVFMMEKPFSKSSFLTATGWLMSAKERIRKTEKKSISLEDKMNEIRLVNRAKWVLISQLKLTEPDAHRYIEKQAMNRCVSKRVIAEEILKTSE